MKQHGAEVMNYTGVAPSVQTIAGYLDGMVTRAHQAHKNGLEEALINLAVSAWPESDLSDLSAPQPTTMTMHNGVRMPLAGFGTWQLAGDDAYNAV